MHPMITRGWYAPLLLVLVMGCNESGSDYRTVNIPDEVRPTVPADSVAPTENPEDDQAVPMDNRGPLPPSETEPIEPQVQPEAVAGTQSDDASAIDNALAVSTARPFAVPMPEPILLASATADSTDSATDASTVPGTPLPGGIKLLIPEKTFLPEGPEKALRVTFDDIDLLKVLNMEPVVPEVMDHLPDWMLALDGKRIRLRGWMFPPSREDGISRFMFVRDNGICCFGRLPKVYDKLAVTLKSGTTTSYIQGRPFDVIGVLSIEADVEDDEVMWLFALDDAEVSVD
ncbi:MAG: hypothetical protein KDA58_13565 [Planctomycetaceae bacterium]|nr:hypothetical protein [Planctomycetaceae bacterium]